MTTRKQSTAKAKQEAEVKVEAAEPAPTPEQEAPAPAVAEPVTPAEIPSTEISGDGFGSALPPIEEELPGIFVRTKRQVKSRRRAGYRFNREGTGIALGLLTAEQIRQLRDDPALEVQDCAFPVTDATEAPGA